MGRYSFGLVLGLPDEEEDELCGGGGPEGGEYINGEAAGGDAGGAKVVLDDCREWRESRLGRLGAVVLVVVAVNGPDEGVGGEAYVRGGSEGAGLDAAGAMLDVEAPVACGETALRKGLVPEAGTGDVAAAVVA